MTSQVQTNDKGRPVKHTIIMGLIGLLSLSGAVSLHAAPATGEVEKTISALEEQWAQAQTANNVDLIAPILADNYVGLDKDGKVSNKAESLAGLKAIKWTSAAIGKMEITAFGDAALVLGDYKTKGTGADGKPVDSHTRYVDTWVKMPSGKWQCVASVESPFK